MSTENISQTGSNVNTFLSAALDHAKNGWPVFPCNPLNKSPYFHGGFKLATTDEKKIRIWWNAHPYACIGLPTGTTSGVFVVDPDEGIANDGRIKNGIGNFKALCEPYPALPQTLTARTPHGGLHLYFRMPTGIDLRSGSNVIAQDVDVRANGGYVILPPSKLTDGKYEWIDTSQIADAPQWLIDLILNSKSRKQNTPGVISVSVQNEDLSNYARAALESEIKAVEDTSSGARNDQLNTSAFNVGQLVAGGAIPEDLAVQKLLLAADKNGLLADPKDGLRKTLRTIQSGLTSGMKNPRSVPQQNSNTAYTEHAGNSADFIMPKCATLPIEAFPKKIQDLLLEVADVTSCPLNIAATAFLSLVSTCVGQIRVLELKDGFDVAPNTFILLVGESSVGKSPVTDLFFNPLEDAEKKAFHKWREEMEEYQKELDIYIKERKKKDCDIVSLKRPIAPTRVEYMVKSATLEALIDVIDRSKRGILLKSDEFSGILAARGRYSNGSTHEMTALFNGCYDRHMVKANTRTSRNVFIAKPCLSVYGEIQPRLLFECISNADESSGFLPRCILVRTEEESPSLWSERTLSSDNKNLIVKLINFLLGLDSEADEYGDVISKKNQLGTSAKTAFVEWYNKLGRVSYWSENKAIFGAYIKKARIHCSKIIEILHLVKSFLGETAIDNPVDKNTVESAILITEYLLINSMQIVEALNRKPPRKDEINVKELTPIEERITSAIVKYKDEIQQNGYRLTNKRLGEIVNEGYADADVLSQKTLGRLCVKLGFTKFSTGKDRGHLITAEKINFLHTMLEQTSEMSETSVCLSGAGFDEKSNVSQTSANVSTDVCDKRADVSLTFTDVCKNGKNVGAKPLSDVSDISFGETEEIEV